MFKDQKEYVNLIRLWPQTFYDQNKWMQRGSKT